MLRKPLVYLLLLSFVEWCPWTWMFMGSSCCFFFELALSKSLVVAQYKLTNSSGLQAFLPCSKEDEDGELASFSVLIIAVWLSASFPRISIIIFHLDIHRLEKSNADYLGWNRGEAFRVACQKHSWLLSKTVSIGVAKIYFISQFLKKLRNWTVFTVPFGDVWKCVVNGFSLRTDPGASASISPPLC